MTTLNSKFQIKKSIYNLIRSLFLLTLLISYVSSETTETTDSNNAKTKIGSGVISIIAFSLLGIIVCVYGQSTTIPLLFIFLGVLIPLFVFIIVYFIPTRKKDDDTEEKTNVYIIWLYFYFAWMIVACIGILVFYFIIYYHFPFIAQKVDSRAQKAYDIRYNEYLDSELKKFEDAKKLRENINNDMPQKYSQNANNLINNNIADGGQNNVRVVNDDNQNRGGRLQRRKRRPGENSNQ